MHATGKRTRQSMQSCRGGTDTAQTLTAVAATATAVATASAARAVGLGRAAAVALGAEREAVVAAGGAGPVAWMQVEAGQGTGELGLPC